MKCCVHIAIKYPSVMPYTLIERLGKVRYARVHEYDGKRGTMTVECEVLPALITVRSVLDGDMVVSNGRVRSYWFGTALSRRLRRLGP